ncbi:MAG TPA: acetyl-coenzyme A synthetase N-terminal domain-containing protein, partial [Jatrophihabitantaceae bacterium]
MTDASSEALANLLHEQRRFEPPSEFAAQANVKADAYDEAAADRLAFWEKQADRLTWATRWSQVLEWDRPFAKWFVGGRLNASVNLQWVVSGYLITYGGFLLLGGRAADLLGRREVFAGGLLLFGFASLLGGV